MTFPPLRRAALAVAAVLLVPLLGAAAPAPTSSGSLGEVDLRYHGWSVSVGPVAPCVTGTASSAGTVTVAGMVEFAEGTSACTTDATGAASTRIEGGRFALTGLDAYGGPPEISLTGFGVSCTATARGADAAIRLGGLTGVRVPNPVPPGYVVEVPGRDGGTLATVTLNEVVAGPDGALSVDLMRVRLHEDATGGDVGGDVVVGTAQCTSG